MLRNPDTLDNPRIPARLSGHQPAVHGRGVVDLFNDSISTARSSEWSSAVAGEFILEADEEMRRFFARIADEMVARLGIGRAEAVARINDAWSEVEFEPYPDLVCHESPGYWAVELYYDEVRSWSPQADRSDWEVRPLPPADSAAWTLPRTG